MSTTLEIVSPAFTKTMTYSNVVRIFWLNLPPGFSSKYLRAGDQMVTLQNSKGEIWQTKFLQKNNGFSAGWGQFARNNQLKVGDFLTFKLIRPQTFMVHIQKVGSLGKKLQIDDASSSSISKKEKFLIRKKPLTVVSPRRTCSLDLGRTAMEGGMCPGTVEEIFKEFKGRRAGMLKALTTDVEDFFHQCDPEKENLCLYGFPDEGWEVKLPPVDVDDILALPEPVLGINFARDGVQRKKWLSLVALHSDAWLLAVSYFYGSRFDKNDRNKLFDMINEVQTLYDVVTGRELAKEETRANKLVKNKMKSGGSKMGAVDVQPKQ